MNTLKKCLYAILLVNTLCSTAYATHKTTHKAVVIVPVADTLGQPIKSCYHTIHASDGYTQLPLSGKGALVECCLACPRIHQLLYNEIVDIVRERGDEVYIRVPNLYYIPRNSIKRYNTFWTLKNNILPLHNLNNEKIDLSKFPKPINYHAHSTEHVNTNVVTLTGPFADPITKQTYSAGTRFVKNENSHNPDATHVWILDPITHQFKATAIPSHLCMEQSHDHATCRKNFLHILTTWANQQDGNIPYVWGGSSFVRTLATDKATAQTRTLSSQKTINFYDLPDTHTPKTGFDCAGMINRAAQIAGLPFYCKNSVTIAKTLTPLKKNDPLQAGDIIYVPGHVMVVANLEKNTLIEARDYDQGYGKTHEIPLHEEFKDIHTYGNLIDAYNKKTPIKRLNKNGTVVQTVRTMKLLKLDSIWT